MLCSALRTHFVTVLQLYHHRLYVMVYNLVHYHRRQQNIRDSMVLKWMSSRPHCTHFNIGKEVNVLMLNIGNHFHIVFFFLNFKFPSVDFQLICDNRFFPIIKKKSLPRTSQKCGTLFIYNQIAFTFLHIYIISSEVCSHVYDWEQRKSTIKIGVMNFFFLQKT